jgi:hypothetical protein
VPTPIGLERFVEAIAPRAIRVRRPRHGSSVYDAVTPCAKWCRSGR